MKLEWMRCFAEIAETGSINKAAENLYLSQPAVTKMMQALEKELNIVLLDRKKTGVELTEQGELFLRHAKTILQEYDTYLSETKKLGVLPGNQLEIVELVMSPTLLQGYHKSVKEAMKRAFPKMKICFVEGNIDKAIQLIQENRQMLAFINFESGMFVETLPKELTVETVYQSAVVCCVNSESGYSDYEVMPEELCQLENQINIGFPEKYSRSKKDDIYNLYTTNLEVVYTTLLNNKKICVLLPECVAEKVFRSDKISYLRVVPSRTVSFGLLYHKDAVKEQIFTRRFLNQFKQELKMILRGI